MWLVTKTNKEREFKQLVHKQPTGYWLFLEWTFLSSGRHNNVPTTCLKLTTKSKSLVLLSSNSLKYYLGNGKEVNSKDNYWDNIKIA